MEFGLLSSALDAISNKGFIESLWSAFAAILI